MVGGDLLDGNRLRGFGGIRMKLLELLPWQPGRVIPALR